MERRPDAEAVDSTGAEPRSGGCPLGRLCEANGRPCGVLRVLRGVQSRILTIARGQKMEARLTDCEAVRTVHSGLAAVSAALPDGRRQLLCLAGPGETLCATSAPGLACWIEALAPSVVCELELAPAQLEDGERVDALLALGRLGRGRLESTFAHMVALGRLDGTERVAAFLVDMTHRLGWREGDELRLKLPMTREDIADHLGLNADTITRILRRLQRDGLIERHNGSDWHLPDLQALEARVPVGCVGGPEVLQGAAGAKHEALPRTPA